MLQKRDEKLSILPPQKRHLKKKKIPLKSKAKCFLIIIISLHFVIIILQSPIKIIYFRVFI